MFHETGEQILRFDFNFDRKFVLEFILFGTSSSTNRLRSCISKLIDFLYF